MIVDSTALPEQAVRDVLASAFQSAGQRCSALRCLYIQQDVAEEFETMLFGAMDELRLGDPWHLATDIGPVIDPQAQSQIAEYIAQARADGRVLHDLTAPTEGHFNRPVTLRVRGIADLIARGFFGPVPAYRPLQSCRSGLRDCRCERHRLWADLRVATPG